MKVVLTSTGQNILDSFEEWRGGSEIVGINSKADVASNSALNARTSRRRHRRRASTWLGWQRFC